MKPEGASEGSQGAGKGAATKSRKAAAAPRTNAAGGKTDSSPVSVPPGEMGKIAVTKTSPATKTAATKTAATKTAATNANAIPGNAGKPSTNRPAPAAKPKHAPPAAALMQVTTVGPRSSAIAAPAKAGGAARAASRAQATSQASPPQTSIETHATVTASAKDIDDPRPATTLVTGPADSSPTSSSPTSSSPAASNTAASSPTSSNAAASSPAASSPTSSNAAASSPADAGGVRPQEAVPAGRPMQTAPMNGRPPQISRASNKDESFAEGDFVVYPTHGVGRVEKIAVEDIAGHRLELIHITFEENRMTLRVPVAKARSAGLRKLATRKVFDEALAVLKGRARVKRTMWSRRAQEYEAKINSGDPTAIAEVVRDLHRNAGQPDQSFSERQIYEAAMDRLAAELAALDQTDKNMALAKMGNYLKTI